MRQLSDSAVLKMRIVSPGASAWPGSCAEGGLQQTGLAGLLAELAFAWQEALGFGVGLGQSGFMCMRYATSCVSSALPLT